MIRPLTLLAFAATAGALSICPLCGTANASRVATVALASYHTRWISAPSVAYTAVAAAQPGPTTSVVTLTVTGMTCGGCVIGVRTVLGRVPGVMKTDVHYDTGNHGTAVVTYDPARATVPQLIAAIATLHYTAAVAQ